MAYTTINKSTDYFNTLLHTGNGSSPRSITGVGFQPDWVMTKNRSAANSNTVGDSVRGTGKTIFTDSTSAELTNNSYGYHSAFASDGFSLTGSAASAGGDNVNKNSNDYVNWCWKANGAGSANTDGSINSTVSVNATSGFSIVKYVGNGGSSGTVGHGLNAVPKMIITKVTSASGDNWKVYHVSSGNTKVLQLNSTDAEATSGAWYNTTPTSSVFSVGNDGATNGSGKTIIAYCFTEKTGYSKFGSYTGNGSTDGSFIYTGFKPAFVIFKRSSGTGGWIIHDNKRSESNGGNSLRKYLVAQTSGSEGTNDYFTIDTLSNGFKLRSTDGESNQSGETYIYMAFGQSIVGSNNIPATAR